MPAGFLLLVSWAASLKLAVPALRYLRYFLFSAGELGASAHWSRATPAQP
jgi:hypothetical protein